MLYHVARPKHEFLLYDQNTGGVNDISSRRASLNPSEAKKPQVLIVRLGGRCAMCGFLLSLSHCFARQLGVPGHQNDG